MRDIEVSPTFLRAACTELTDLSDGQPIPRVQRLELSAAVDSVFWDARLHFQDGTVEECRARFRYVAGRDGAAVDLRGTSILGVQPVFRDADVAEVDQALVTRLRGE